MTIEGFCNAVTKPKKYSGENANLAVSLRVAYNFVGEGAERGSTEEFTEFYELSLFGNRAESVLKHVDSGDKLYIKGSVIPKAYKTKDGDIRISNTLNASVITPTFDSKERRGRNSNGSQGKQDEYTNRPSQRVSNDDSYSNDDSSDDYGYDDGYGDDVYANDLLK